MSDWIEWKGGECPVPTSTRADVRFASGERYDNVSASCIGWSHLYSDDNVIAYRIHKPEGGA